MERFIVWDGPGFYVPQEQDGKIVYKRWGQNFFQEFFCFPPESVEYFSDLSEVNATAVEPDSVHHA